MPKILFNTKVERYDCSGCRFFDQYKKVVIVNILKLV